jgi:hypothetical protein
MKSETSIGRMKIKITLLEVEGDATAMKLAGDVLGGLIGSLLPAALPSEPPKKRTRRKLEAKEAVVKEPKE